MPLLQTTVHLTDAWGRPKFSGPRTLVWAGIAPGVYILVDSRRP